MTTKQLKSYWNDLRCFTLFRKRYKTPQKKSAKYWHAVARDYGNTQKKIAQSGCRWRIIMYYDGRRELAYLRVRKVGILHSAGLYQGIIFPRRIGIGQYAHIKDIRIAF